jgi:hypothetical protein
MTNYYINLSERILEIAKLGEDCAELRKELYYMRMAGLESKIDTDELKTCFWVNIYEAYLLIMVSENVDYKKIFKFKRIKLSHCLLSLYDIEYGILRMKKFNLLFKNFYNPFYPTYINRLAVEKVDSVRHINLNKSVLETLSTGKS